MAIATLLCYTENDKKLANQLKKHLAPLKRNEIITILDYGNIISGSELQKEMDRYLEDAQIILLLISSDFISSNYHYHEVMKKAIMRHERKEVRVIPVIMRPVHWEDPPLDKLQALPDRTRAVTTWKNRDEGFKNIVDGLIKVVKEWKEHNLAGPTMERKAFMEHINQLINTAKSELQPPGRAMAIASTLQQLSILTPTDVTLADLILGWQILSHPIEQDEDDQTKFRRITCGELAQLASSVTTEDGKLSQAIKAWNSWREAFQHSDDPRQAAMAKTFARELSELEKEQH